jgi:hypothetical protein
MITHRTLLGSVGPAGPLLVGGCIACGFWPLGLAVSGREAIGPVVFSLNGLLLSVAAGAAASCTA